MTDRLLTARQAAERLAVSPEAVEHVCEGCGETFTPRRSDARFCRAACRSAKWRPIIHHAVHHHPGGFPLAPNRSGFPGVETCAVQLSPDEFCRRPAPWRHDFVRNRERAIVGSEFLCDDHVGALLGDGVVVDESIRDVMLRDGREARRRHGTRAPGDYREGLPAA